MNENAVDAATIVLRSMTNGPHSPSRCSARPTVRSVGPLVVIEPSMSSSPLTTSPDSGDRMRIESTAKLGAAAASA